MALNTYHAASSSIHKHHFEKQPAVPAVAGIKGTLSSTGISRVVTSAGGIFRGVDARRAPESIALTSPRDATGLFELNPMTFETPLPFEGLGVDTAWEFRMPKAAKHRGAGDPNVVLYFARAAGQSFEIPVTHLHFTTQDGAGPFGDGATSIDGVISTRRANGATWGPMIGKAPFGEWELALPDDLADGRRPREMFENEEIEDILSSISSPEGTRPVAGRQAVAPSLPDEGSTQILVRDRSRCLKCAYHPADRRMVRWHSDASACRPVEQASRRTYASWLAQADLVPVAWQFLDLLNGANRVQAIYPEPAARSGPLPWVQVFACWSWIPGSRMDRHAD